MTVWQEQRQLNAIEAELTASAPGLAGMLRTFTRLTEGERPCGMERFPQRGRRLRSFLGQPGIVGVLALTVIVMSGMLLAVLATPGPRPCPGRAVASHASQPVNSGAPPNADGRSLLPAGGGCPVYVTKR
jgi:hypothetical protein